MSTRVRPSELWAEACIQRELGAVVKQYDDNSQPGMFDLKIVRSGSSPDAVEVTSATDSTAAEALGLD